MQLDILQRSRLIESLEEHFYDTRLNELEVLTKHYLAYLHSLDDELLMQEKCDSDCAFETIERRNYQ